MKPTLRLDTGRDTFFTAPYVNVTPLPASIPGDNLEDGYSFKTDRSRWQRTKRWVNGKARGGSVRRLVVLGLFGVLWLGLYFYKQRVCTSLVVFKLMNRCMLRGLVIAYPTSDRDRV